MCDALELGDLEALLELFEHELLIDLRLLRDEVLLGDVLEVLLVKDDLADKLEGYCKFIKNLESDIDGLKAEETRLKARRQTMENTVKRAKEAMKTAMLTAGEKKIAAGSFTVNVQLNPPKLVLDEQYLENIPEKYLIPQEPEINKKQMLEDLKADENLKELEGVCHLERDESLRIK